MNTEIIIFYIHSEYRNTIWFIFIKPSLRFGLIKINVGFQKKRRNNMKKETMIKLHTYRSLKEAMAEELAGAGKRSLTKLTAETFCIAHDYDYELCLSLLDEYYENEYWYIHSKVINNQPYIYILEGALERINSKLLLAAVEGKTYFK